MRKNEALSGNQFTLRPTSSSFDRQRRPGEKRPAEEDLSSRPPSQITSETAHDLNNALGSIRLYVDLLEAEADNAARVRQHVQQMKPAVEHAAGMARELLGFGSAQRPSPPISLNSVLEGMGPMLSTLPRRDVALRLRLSPSLALVAIDPAHVIRIVLNLVLNACDAMPKGGEVMIETANWRVEGQLGKWRPSSVSKTPPGADERGCWVMLRVRDTGKGMSDAARARIFQPFLQPSSQQTYVEREPG
jgi:signal transduction histidine kinase